MNGFELVFYTEENKKHGGKLLGEWILEKAKSLGAPGGSLSTCAEGFGHKGKMHSAGFIELADRPVLVSVIATNETCEALMKALDDASVDVFYTRFPTNFGRTGNDKA